MDDRHADMCAYCGARPDTRDHVPSKVLLDEPYPPQLPIVGACGKCNASFSKDEQYLACFIDCVICGSAETKNLRRANVRRIMDGNPALQQRIKVAKKEGTEGKLSWEPEVERVINVVLKLARGYTAYELYPKIDKPSSVKIIPLQALSEQEISAFELIVSESSELVPEIGSRAFFRIFCRRSVDNQPLPVTS